MSREKHAGSPEDYAIVAAWLDEREPLPDGQLFMWRAALWGAAADQASGRFARVRL
jgi:hypothetical protein